MMRLQLSYIKCMLIALLRQLEIGKLKLPLPPIIRTSNDTTTSTIIIVNNNNSSRKSTVNISDNNHDIHNNSRSAKTGCRSAVDYMAAI